MTRIRRSQRVGDGVLGRRGADLQEQVAVALVGVRLVVGEHRHAHRAPRACASEAVAVVEQRGARRAQVIVRSSGSEARHRGSRCRAAAAACSRFGRPHPTESARSRSVAAPEHVASSSAIGRRRVERRRGPRARARRGDAGLGGDLRSGIRDAPGVAEPPRRRRRRHRGRSEDPRRRRCRRRRATEKATPRQPRRRGQSATRSLGGRASP